MEDERPNEVDDTPLVNEEGDGEEDEHPPPGYRVADGLYKAFCACQDKITCSFCSWFHLIRDCQVHGKATKKPLISCKCRQTAELEDLTEPQSNRIPRPVESFKSLPNPCECGKTKALECSCLDDVVSSSFGSVSGSDDDGFDDIREEDKTVEDDTTDEAKDGDEVLDLTTNGESKISTRERQPTIQAETLLQSCTCDDEPQPRSGSSSEMESSTSESSEIDVCSHYDLGLFENLEGTSSDISSSENSSAEGADIDWTSVKWVHNASDRSVESVSDDDFEDWKKRRAAVKKLQSRPRRRPHTRQTSAVKPTRFQYLVVQQSRRKNFFDICKNKKDLPPSCTYRLMSLI